MTYDKCLPVNKYRDWLIEQAQNGAQYWYGVIYQRATAGLLASKAKQYPDHYKSNRMRKYNSDIARQVFVGDCVNGAVKGAIWTDLGTHAIKYKSHGCPDTNADGMYNLCKINGEHGTIDTVPDRAGLLLHKSGHVGVTIGDGKAVEFRGFDYGCVITEIKKRDWKEWAVIPWVDYSAVVEKSPEGDADPTHHVTTGNVWARTSPAVADDNKAFVIKAGSVVDVVAPCDGWTMINVNGTTRYVSSKYIKEE